MTTTIVGRTSTSFLIRIGQKRVILTPLNREAAGKRPESPSVNTELANERIRKQSGYAAIAVAKRVNPGEAVMARSYCNHLSRPGQLARFVTKAKMLKQSGHELARRGNVSSNFHVSGSQLARLKGRFLAARGGGNTHFRWELRIKQSVEFAKKTALIG